MKFVIALCATLATSACSTNRPEADVKAASSSKKELPATGDFAKVLHVTLAQLTGKKEATKVAVGVVDCTATRQSNDPEDAAFHCDVTIANKKTPFDNIPAMLLAAALNDILEANGISSEPKDPSDKVARLKVSSASCVKTGTQYNCKVAL